MAAVVPGITTKPRYFQRKTKDRFFPPWPFLRSRNFFPRDFLPTSLHASLARAVSHALEPIIGKRNGITFRPVGPIPGARDGVRAPRGTWLRGDWWKTPEQNGVYVKRAEVGNDIRYATQSVCDTQPTCKRQLTLRLQKGLPEK